LDNVFHAQQKSVKAEETYESNEMIKLVSQLLL